jgi:ribonuclease T2
LKPDKPLYAELILLWHSHRYWIAQNQPNYQFWQHEFSKHATCFSSFDTGFNGTNNCYGVTYQEGEDIVDFYETVALHYLKYPSYDWLSAAGIVPSNSTSYKLSQFQDALTKASGALPFVSLLRGS